MSRMSLSDLRLLRNRMLPTFDLTKGNVEDKIQAVERTFFQYDRKLIFGLMNPNFEQICNAFGNNSNISEILCNYGRCIGNNYEDGMPIDPILLTKIDYDDVIILSNTGYCNESMSQLLSVNMKNPLDNLYVSQNDMHGIEKDLAVDSEDYLAIMNGY